MPTTNIAQAKQARFSKNGAEAAIGEVMALVDEPTQCSGAPKWCTYKSAGTVSG